MTDPRDPPASAPPAPGQAGSDITRLARDGHLPPVVPEPAAVVQDADATVVTGGDATVASHPTHLLLAPSAPVKRPDTPLALPVGYQLHEYRVDKVLGQGGFGITYLASDVNLNARVAIKEYLPEQFACRTAEITVAPRSANDEDFYQKGLESYLVEARTLATFRHPHIVRVARFFEANNTAYMVLEYERGESLKAWWRAHADMAEIDLLTLLLPLLDGLAVVHESGFLHRDIKPDNIYVRDADGSLVLLDFGAARHTSEERTEENNFVTPGYGPIEQYVLGEQGPWTDIYALGATLYWMVSGRKPIEAPDRMVANDPLKPAVEVGKGRYSEAFLKAIDWALKPETQDRPRDIAEFRNALFAAHPSSLNLQAALRAGDGAVAEQEGWLAVLRSPRLLKDRISRTLTALVRPRSWPLAVKMTLAMVLTALTPMLLTAWYNYTGSVERVSASEVRDLEQLAGSVAGRVSQLITDSKNLAAYLGTDEAFVQFLKSPTDSRKRDVQKKLEDLARSNSDVQVATVLNAGGDALASSFEGVAGRNFKFRQYFQEALAGKSHVTGIIIGATAGEPGVFFAHPVRSESGGVIGVVTLRLRGSAIAASLEEARGISARPHAGGRRRHPDSSLRSVAHLQKPGATGARHAEGHRCRPALSPRRHRIPESSGPRAKGRRRQGGGQCQFSVAACGHTRSRRLCAGRGTQLGGGNGRDARHLRSAVARHVSQRALQRGAGRARVRHPRGLVCPKHREADPGTHGRGLCVEERRLRQRHGEGHFG